VGPPGSIIVTGSSGFIGSALSEQLKANGYTVMGFDLSQKNDITKMSDLDGFFQNIASEDIGTAVHLAASMFVPRSWEKPHETFFVNVVGTLNLLEQCRVHDINRFIYASSYIYGKPDYLPVDEKHPVKPSNPYAHSKLLAEELCRSYFEDYGLKCVILRPFNVYGPNQSINFLIPTIISQLSAGKIELKDSKPKRDFLFISDMVEAYLKAIKLENFDFEIINIGSGKSYSVSEIVEIILNQADKSVSVEYLGEERVGEIPETVADITKAKNLLGWEPKVAIEDGLKALLKQ
jgi:UDP-glucose 4-epimerase